MSCGWPVSRILSGRRRLPRWPFIWPARCRAGLAAYPGRHVQGRHADQPLATPIRHCSRWGLPCHRRCRQCGGLLHHRFTLACVQAVCSLWRYPSGLPGRELPGTAALWSPDFPRGEPRDHPAIRTGWKVVCRPTAVNRLSTRPGRLLLKNRRPGRWHQRQPHCF